MKSSEALLTWVEQCVDTDLPRSHESTDLLHISSPYDVLEDDVIWEVHSPLCWCDSYYGCRLLLRLCALCGAAPRAFAVSGDACRCSPVRWCVLWWDAMRWATLSRGVLACRGICGCVLCWCVLWGGAMGRCVVCWCVLWAAWVCRHGCMVVVLHPRCDFFFICLLLCCQPRMRKRRIHKKAAVQPKRQILLRRLCCPSSSLLTIPLLSSCSISGCSGRTQTIHQSFAWLHCDPSITASFLLSAVKLSHLGLKLIFAVSLLLHKSVVQWGK